MDGRKEAGRTPRWVGRLGTEGLVVAAALAVAATGGWALGRWVTPGRGSLAGPPVTAGSATSATGGVSAVGRAAARPPTDAATVAEGRVLFMRYCAFCHGIDGRGGGLPARGLRPPPTDLAGFAARRWSDAQLFSKITAGEPGTAMPAWGPILSETQRWQVVAFIRVEVQRE